jgi:hypothetical protein
MSTGDDVALQPPFIGEASLLEIAVFPSGGVMRILGGRTRPLAREGVPTFRALEDLGEQVFSWLVFVVDFFVESFCCPGR